MLFMGDAQALQKLIYSSLAYNTEINMQAIMTLSYEEFMNFFSFRPDNRLVLFRRLYEKFAEKLSPLCRQVFSLFYDSFNEDEYSLRNSPVFYNQPPVDPLAAEFNLYLHGSGKYRQTWAALKSGGYRMFQCDISGLALGLEPEAKNDVILLSNIADYIHLIQPGDDHLEQF